VPFAVHKPDRIGLLFTGLHWSKVNELESKTRFTQWNAGAKKHALTPLEKNGITRLAARATGAAVYCTEIFHVALL